MPTKKKTKKVSLKRKSKGRKIKNITKGYKSLLKGIQYESKVKDYFSKKGYKIIKTGGEADIIAFRKGWLLEPDVYLFIECKNKKKIPVSDFIKFIEKFKQFKHEKEIPGEVKVIGYFVYSGELSSQIEFLHQNLEKKLKESIKLLHYRN